MPGCIYHLCHKPPHPIYKGLGEGNAYTIGKIIFNIMRVIFPPVTWIMNLTINLINRIHYYVKEENINYFENTNCLIMGELKVTHNIMGELKVMLNVSDKLISTLAGWVCKKIELEMTYVPIDLQRYHIILAWLQKEAGAITPWHHANPSCLFVK